MVLIYNILNTEQFPIYYFSLPHNLNPSILTCIFDSHLFIDRGEINYNFIFYTNLHIIFPIRLHTLSFRRNSRQIVVHILVIYWAEKLRVRKILTMPSHIQMFLDQIEDVKRLSEHAVLDANKVLLLLINHVRPVAIEDRSVEH